VWASLFNHETAKESAFRPHFYDESGGVRVLEFREPACNSIMAVRYDWIMSHGGLTQPNKYYGGIEDLMWHKIKADKKRWVYLPDFKESHPPVVQSDPDFAQYKREYGNERKTDLEFSAWLEEKKCLKS
jgi:hypothetical protein